MKTKAKALTDAERIGTLAGTILFVIGGLRSGSIKAQPIVDTGRAEDGAYPVLSLESHLWEALGKCGIHEARAAEKKSLKPTKTASPRSPKSTRTRT